MATIIRIGPGRWDQRQFMISSRRGVATEMGPTGSGATNLPQPRRSKGLRSRSEVVG